MDIYATKLREEGFEVEEATNGEMAFEKLRESQPDLILLDIILPKMDGWTFLQKIKSNEKIKDIPVIIVSNLFDEASQAHGIELGVKDYLVKTNYTTAELVDKIKQLTK